MCCFLGYSVILDNAVVKYYLSLKGYLVEGCGHEELGGEMENMVCIFSYKIRKLKRFWESKNSTLQTISQRFSNYFQSFSCR